MRIGFTQDCPVTVMDGEREKEDEVVGKEGCDQGFFFFFHLFFLFVCFRASHYGSSRLGVESELHLPVYTTATAILDP